MARASGGASGLPPEAPGEARDAALNELIGRPELVELYRYWADKRRERRMPARADIDPTELPGRLWEHLMLMDVVREADALDFRYRVVGGEIEREIGRSVTGASAAAVTGGWGAYGRFLNEIYSEVATTGRPSYVENIFLPRGRRLPTLTRRLLLPLSAGGTQVDMVLSGHFFERPPHLRQGMAADIDSFREVVRHLL